MIEMEKPSETAIAASELFSVTVHKRNGDRVEHTSLQGVTGRSRTRILRDLLQGRPNLKREIFVQTQRQGNNGSR